MGVHHQYADQAAAYALGALTPDERALFEAHLADCADCRLTQEAFRSLLGKMNGGDPIAAWAKTKAEHPRPGELVNVGREQLGELATFLQRQSLITMPTGDQPAESQPSADEPHEHEHGEHDHEH